MSAIEKTYTGSAQAASGASAKLENNTSISNATFTYTYYSGTSCSGTALSGAPTAAGSYSVKATLTGTANYNTSTSPCRTYTMNPRPVTISIRHDDTAWSNSGINVALYKNGSEVYPSSLATAEDDTIVFNEVVADTYNI